MVRNLYCREAIPYMEYGVASLYLLRLYQDELYYST